MKFWIYLNGIQQGPYTFEQVKLLPLEPTTPVWYDGLPKWLPAAQAPATAPLFAAQPQAEPQVMDDGCGQAFGAPAPAAGPVYAPQPAMQQPAAGEPMPKRPPTYMVWCILFTILCCSPVALAGIITGSISTSRYNAGDYEGAQRMSNATEWLLIISIVWAIIGLPVSIAFNL